MFSLNFKIRRLAALGMWLALSVSCTKTSQPDTTDAPRHILIVGMELAYPPFEMQDDRGNPSGVSVDLARALAEYLHEPVSIENIPFSGLIPALKTGKVDVVISSMTETPERARSIDFSDPYLSTGLCLLVKKNSPIQGIDQKPKRIVVKGLRFEA